MVESRRWPPYVEFSVFFLSIRIKKHRIVSASFPMDTKLAKEELAEELAQELAQEQAEEQAAKERENAEMEEEHPIPIGSSNHLAAVRTAMARSRTFMAAERTFSAWIRTGFAIAGAGATIGTALKNSDSRELSWTIGAALIVVGMLAFLYAWRSYKNVYDFIRHRYELMDVDTQSFQFNLITITVITIILLAASLLGFYLMFS